jgi:hypothetical protein
MAAFTITAEFQHGGCLDLRATLGANKVPTLFVKMRDDDAATVFKKMQVIKKSDFSIVGEVKVERLLQILEGVDFTGLAASEPNCNVSCLEILGETTKAFKTSGIISADGTDGFFTPVKSMLVTEKSTATNYFAN